MRGRNAYRFQFKTFDSPGIEFDTTEGFTEDEAKARLRLMWRSRRGKKIRDIKLVEKF